MIKGRSNTYKPNAVDFNQQTTRITIDSFDSSTIIDVVYKMRDKWTFKVGGGLTVKNLRFDAADSSLQYS